MPKGTKVIPYLRTENLKKHTLSRGTYLYSQYMGVPPPPPLRTDTTTGTMTELMDNISIMLVPE